MDTKPQRLPIFFIAEILETTYEVDDYKLLRRGGLQSLDAMHPLQLKANHYNKL